MNGLYDMIFKRKSFHLFRGVGNEKLSQEELQKIEAAYGGFEPLTKTAVYALAQRKAEAEK